MNPLSTCSYDPIEILRIQVVARALENEAMMRYVSNADNANAIVRILKSAQVSLGQLRGTGKCPIGWVHEPDCRCTPEVDGSEGSSLNALLLRIEHLDKEVQVLYETVRGVQRGKL